MRFSTINRVMAVAGVVLALGTGGSQAADLLIPVAPVADPGIDWTGFYAGVHLGYANAPVSGTWAGGIQNFNLSGDVVEYDMTGGFIGGQVGYNHQMDSIVLGVEGSLSLGNISGGAVQFDSAIPDVTVTAQSTINWFSDLVVRGGVTVNDNLLLYGTVGLAAAMVDLEVTAEGVLNAVANDSQLHYGPTIGIGGEYRIDDQWSVGADLRYAALGQRDYEDPAVISGGATLDISRTTFTLRLNYRF